MTLNRGREIVIEYERVELIRKRASTELAYCGTCAANSDFVGIESAAELFETPVTELQAFVRRNDCHFQLREAAGEMLCVASLLATMRLKTNVGPELISGGKK